MPCGAPAVDSLQPSNHQRPCCHPSCHPDNPLIPARPSAPPLPSPWLLQYVGSVLTVWGVAALVWTQAPAGLGWLALYWTLLYVITGWQESS